MGHLAENKGNLPDCRRVARSGILSGDLKAVEIYWDFSREFCFLKNSQEDSQDFTKKQFTWNCQQTTRKLLKIAQKFNLGNKPLKVIGPLVITLVTLSFLNCPANVLWFFCF